MNPSILMLSSTLISQRVSHDDTQMMRSSSTRKDKIPVSYEAGSCEISRALRCPYIISRWVNTHHQVHFAKKILVLVFGMKIPSFFFQVTICFETEE
jgi:hypothetical protein